MIILTVTLYYYFLVQEQFIILTMLLPSLAILFILYYLPPVVLSSTIKPQLTIILRQVYKVKGPLKNIIQHIKCLQQILSQLSAIQTLYSILFLMALQALDIGLQYQIIYIKAYIMYINMAYINIVAFKLTLETINTLVKLYRDIYSVCTQLNI